MARSRLALERVGRRRRQQLARLVIADRRRLAFAAFRLRPLDAFDRVMGDGVLLAQIFEQRGERREPVPDRAAAEPAPHQLVAPGDDVRARHGAKFFRPHDAGEAHEVLHRVFVGAPGLRIAEIGEPLDLGRHVGQPVKLGGGQQPVGGASAISAGSCSLMSAAASRCCPVEHRRACARADIRPPVRRGRHRSGRTRCGVAGLSRIESAHAQRRVQPAVLPHRDRPRPGRVRGRRPADRRPALERSRHLRPQPSPRPAFTITGGQGRRTARPSRLLIDMTIQHKHTATL